MHISILFPTERICFAIFSQTCWLMLVHLFLWENFEDLRDVSRSVNVNHPEGLGIMAWFFWGMVPKYQRNEGSVNLVVWNGEITTALPFFWDGCEDDEISFFCGPISTTSALVRPSCISRPAKPPALPEESILQFLLEVMDRKPRHKKRIEVWCRSWKLESLMVVVSSLTVATVDIPFGIHLFLHVFKYTFIILCFWIFVMLFKKTFQTYIMHMVSLILGNPRVLNLHPEPKSLIVPLIPSHGFAHSHCWFYYFS